MHLGLGVGQPLGERPRRPGPTRRRAAGSRTYGCSRRSRHRRRRCAAPIARDGCRSRGSAPRRWCWRCRAPRPRRRSRRRQRPPGPCGSGGGRRRGRRTASPAAAGPTSRATTETTSGTMKIIPKTATTAPSATPNSPFVKNREPLAPTTDSAMPMPSRTTPDDRRAGRGRRVTATSGEYGDDVLPRRQPGRHHGGQERAQQTRRRPRSPRPASSRRAGRTRRC